MEFTVYRSSDIFNEHTIEINSLEDLKSLYDKEGTAELIINFDRNYIEIYDDYRE